MLGRHRPSLGALVVAAAIAIEPARATAQEPSAPRDVTDPAELERVRGEIQRLEAERKRIVGAEATLEERARAIERNLAGLSRNPVLKPRIQVKTLTVDEAIARALEFNADLIVQAIAAEEAQEDAEIQRAPFDPVLSSTAQWSHNNTPGNSLTPTGDPFVLSQQQKGFSFTNSVQQLFKTGTTLKAEYDDGLSRTNSPSGFQPSYTPKVRAEVTQSLLKSFWPNPLDVNNAQILAAEANAGAADANYAQQLMNGVVQVEQAYWDVVKSESDLKISESSLARAMKILDEQRRRRAVAAATELEVTIAEAGVAQRREAVVVAENQLERSRDALVKITEPVSDENRYDVFLVPVDKPDPVRITEPDADEAIRIALARRPDYRASELQLESARQLAIAADNAALPQLEAFGFLEEDGLWQTSRGSWTELGHGHFYSAGGGLRLTLPLFLRAERAQARKAHLEVDRSAAALKALENQIRVEVRDVIRDIRTARARIDASHASRAATEKQVAAMGSQLRLGIVVARQVFDTLSDFDQAWRNETQALIDLRIAHRTLDKAMGTVLDPFAEKLRPRIRRAFSLR